MKDQLDLISDIDADRIIENAFVPSFRILCRGSITDKHWNKYINQYRGYLERDYPNIEQVLRDEYGFKRLADPGEKIKKFASQVSEFLIRRASMDAGCAPEEIGFKVKDKCNRDGALFAAVHAARDANRQAGIRATTIILSSARLLKEADEVLRGELGQPDAVVSQAALATLLTLTPGVQMGLGTLRGVLFDLKLAARLTPAQRLTYRLIAASEEFELPWSRRQTLQKELGIRILEDARSRGQSAGETIRKIIRSDDTHYTAKIIAEALDNMAITPETRQEVENLRAEIQELRKQLVKRDGHDQHTKAKTNANRGIKKRLRRKK